LKLTGLIKEYWSYIAALILPFLAAIGMWFCSDEVIREFVKDVSRRTIIQHWICFSIPVIAVIYILILVFSQIPKWRNNNILKSKVEDYQNINTELIQSLSVIWEGYLYTLAKSDPLNFCSNSCSERISLYKYEQENNHFVLLGRYSGNPEYDKKGRAIYKSDQGCIAKAWKDGMYFVNDYPCYDEDGEAYIARSCQDGLTVKITRGLTMKSRLFFGYRLHNESGRNPIAIVIIESTNPERYLEEELKEIFEGHTGQYLSKLTIAFSSMMPNIDQAKKAGF
jgi:hypothetical protein